MVRHLASLFLQQYFAASRTSLHYALRSFCTAQQTTGKNGPLEGIKVLDLGQVVAGNFCGAVLAYFGADVIKVEPPGTGDALRTLRSLDGSGTSLWWRTYGRNRRCITVDLRKEEGREIVRRLSERVDILVENFRPGVMEKWGLGPKDLKAELVYTRISGYGQTGPRSSQPGYASSCEAYGGFRYINGYPDRAPVRPNVSLGDTLAGLHAALGAVMAVLHQTRQRTGAPGQVVDAAITECMFNMLEGCVPEYAMYGLERQPSGSTISGVVPSGTWKTADGQWVVIGGNGNSVYSRLMAAVGRSDMGADNPLYADDSKRCDREQEICEAIGDWVSKRAMDEVVSVLNEARVPAGPILSIGQIMSEEQFKQRNMFHATQPPSGGDEVVLPAMLPVLSATPGSTKWAGPDLGHHTDDVLREELSMTAQEIADLRTIGAI